MLEISCGRGGGFCHLIAYCRPISCDWSGFLDQCHSILYSSLHGSPECRVCVRACPASAVRDMSFDVVVNVEASHVYRDDAAFPGGEPSPSAGWQVSLCRLPTPVQCPYAGAARDTGFSGTFHDITANVVAACQLDAGRRQAFIRAAVPWYYRVLANERLKRYAAVPGTVNFERFRAGTGCTS